METAIPDPDKNPQPPMPTPGPRAGSREHSRAAESLIFDVSVRAWIALLVVLTLCLVVLIITVRVPDIEQSLPAIKDTFLPTVSLIIAFYFATKKNENKNQP